MTPEERAAAIAMLGGGAAGGAAMNLGQNAMQGGPPMPMAPQPQMPQMSQADFSYGAAPARGRTPMTPESARKLAQMLRGASRAP